MTPLDDTGGTSPMIGVRLPKSQNQRLRDAARKRRTSVSDLIRRFADEGLARLEPASAANGPPDGG
jgi:hypothetical protein